MSQRNGSGKPPTSATQKGCCCWQAAIITGSEFRRTSARRTSGFHSPSDSVLWTRTGTATTSSANSPKNSSRQQTGRSTNSLSKSKRNIDCRKDADDGETDTTTETDDIETSVSDASPEAEKGEAENPAHPGMINREICRHETLELITPTDDCTVHSLEKPLSSVNPFLVARKTPELLALGMVSDGDIRKPKPSQGVRNGKEASQSA